MGLSNKNISFFFFFTHSPIKYKSFLFAYDPIKYNFFFFLHMTLSNANNFKTDQHMGLTGTTTLSQSGPGSNVNEGVLHTPQISRTGALPSDAVECYIQNTLFRGGS